jgi:hypothetical protein
MSGGPVGDKVPLSNALISDPERQYGHNEAMPHNDNKGGADEANGSLSHWAGQKISQEALDHNFRVSAQARIPTLHRARTPIVKY